MRIFDACFLCDIAKGSVALIQKQPHAFVFRHKQIGKAVIVYGFPNPGGRSDTALSNGSLQRAEAGGAAAIFVTLGMPGNITNEPQAGGTTPPAKVPVFMIGNDDSTRGEMALALDKLRERDVKHFVYLYESKAVLEHSIGLSYEAKGDLEAAREAYGRALQEDLSYYPAHVRLGRMALTAGDTATALSELDLAVQLKGDDPWVQAHYGATLAQAGRLGDAVEHLRKAIELEPFYPIPYYLLGRVAEMMGNSAGAVEHYRGFLARASGRDPRVADVNEHLAALNASAREKP